MATYKVIQDIEAEDKLLGPLTLKQFIFAGIALTCAYLGVMSIARGVPLLLILLAPPMVFTGVMAWPWSRDQPTETWLLAKLRFFFKPRRRIWDQNGMKELVTITAPKRDEHIYTNNLSQTEVKSRLQALANTIDSRGWAIKNVNVNLFAQPAYAGASTDRLIDPMSLPKEVSNTDVTPSDDILDEQNNPTAQHLDQMIQATSTAHRQQLVNQMQQAASNPGQTPEQADYWFLNQTTAPQAGMATFDNSALVAPGNNSTSSTSISKQDEQALLAQLHKQERPKAAFGHMKTIDPEGKKQITKDKKPDLQAQAIVPKTPSPANQQLSQNNDWDVATIARQVNKPKQEPPDNEVVISLR